MLLDVHSWDFELCPELFALCYQWRNSLVKVAKCSNSMSVSHLKTLRGNLRFSHEYKGNFLSMADATITAWNVSACVERCITR